MPITGPSLNNPDPSNWTNITYQVKSGDCLWNLAMNVAMEEAKAKGQTLSGASLQTATANELALIEQANPQIVGSNGSGTYDLIYAGDNIAIPVQTPDTSVPAVTVNPGTAGFNAPSQPGVTDSGLWAESTQLTPGQDILSASGGQDLVMLPNGDLVLYALKTPYHRSENYADDIMVWQSGTVGQPVAYAVQNGGNIDLYASDGTVIKSIPGSSLSSELFQADTSAAPNDGLLIGLSARSDS
jgi:hypothetical protein